MTSRDTGRSSLDFLLRATLLAALGIASGACSESSTPGTAGNADRGRALLHQYGCHACHRIPHVLDAIGTAGPPLDDIGSRVYLAGTLPNTAVNMKQWIRKPQAFKPGTAMPDLNVSDQDATDMVAYLDRLR